MDDMTTERLDEELKRLGAVAREVLREDGWVHPREAAELRGEVARLTRERDEARARAEAAERERDALREALKEAGGVIRSNRHSWVRDGISELPGTETHQCERCGVRVDYEPATGRIKRIYCRPVDTEYVLRLTPGERYTIEVALWMMLRHKGASDAERTRATALYDSIAGLSQAPAEREESKP